MQQELIFRYGSDKNHNPSQCVGNILHEQRRPCTWLYYTYTCAQARAHAHALTHKAHVTLIIQGDAYQLFVSIVLAWWYTARVHRSPLHRPTTTRKMCTERVTHTCSTKIVVLETRTYTGTRVRVHWRDTTSMVFVRIVKYLKIYSVSASYTHTHTWPPCQPKLFGIPSARCTYL